MNDFKTSKKKLLILGGTSSSIDVVETAKRMGIYTIVADDRDHGVAKDAADEKVKISTTDMDSLLSFIRSKKIDGVFCGPSGFNIQNAMQICELAGLPFYATKEQWDICMNKDSFKRLCKEFNVPVVPGYDTSVNADKLTEKNTIKYPVIVKPVDGSSSKGITVCYSGDELIDAYKKALEFSRKGEVLVEKYIDNGGIVTSVRYISCKGELYLSLTGDTYIVDPVNRTALISALTIYPSKHTKNYIENTDAQVCKMFKSIGLENGVLFMQSLPENNDIFFHEMGLRLSGGLTYTITESANGINDLEMMIRYAVGGPMCSDNEIERIDPYLGGKIAASLCIPLKPGIIGSINGLEDILDSLDIESFAQYYWVGDQVTADKIGTLMQHFGRFKFFANNIEEIVHIVENIQKNLLIRDSHDNDMIYKYFDTDRLK